MTARKMPSSRNKQNKQQKEDECSFDIQNGRMGEIPIIPSKRSCRNRKMADKRQRKSNGNFPSTTTPARTTSSALNQMKYMTKRAALASKRKIWDTNDASIDAAQTAVDHWESTYNTLRSVLVTSVSSAKTMYETAKNGASGIEHHLFVPVRDYVIMPAFSGAERITCDTVGFIQSEEARQLADCGLDVVRRTPFVGEGILAPALVTSARCIQTAWEVAKYPIPSKDAVRCSVDQIMTGTKWAIGTSIREIYFYAKLVDATITRSLMHTQWRVLGSGPYATLDHNHKREVIDHICERYLSLKTIFARYELAAHIRAHNRCLYDDLVVSGLLLDRCRKSRNILGLEEDNVGSDEDDVWLLPCPIYQSEQNECPMLLQNGTFYSARRKVLRKESGAADVAPIWFYLPYLNGKRPGKDVSWVRFNESDRCALEHGFVSHVGALAKDINKHDNVAEADVSKDNDVLEDLTDSSQRDKGLAHIDVSEAPKKPISIGISSSATPPERITPSMSTPNNGPYPTTAQWYEPDFSRDIFVDQKRHVVSLLRRCHVCQSAIEQPCSPPLRRKADQENTCLCDQCCQSSFSSPSSVESQIKFSSRCVGKHCHLSPSVSFVMRPTMWRFYGPGNEVRRGVWLLDTKRHGLQPYSEESSAVLEDAYLFLKWSFQNSRAEGGKNDIDSVLLTVQVASPDGEEQQLVQFRSLSKVTAIQKTLGGAFSVFKTRVYRGARLNNEGEPSTDGPSVSHFPADTPGSHQNMNYNENDSSTTEDITCFDDETGSAISLSAPVCKSMENGFSSEEMENNCYETNNDVEHLVLVVHGIGEMLRSSDLFGIAMGTLSSIVDCCTWLRKNHEEVLSTHVANATGNNVQNDLSSKKCQNAVKEGRVEYIPVEWHEAFALQSRRNPAAGAGSESASAHQGIFDSNRNSFIPTLNDISLQTIPHLRAFANDTALDILYFMSPDYHDIIIDIVTQEMNFIVERFRRIAGFNGKISIMAHSLGSVITWDILSHQNTGLIDGWPSSSAVDSKQLQKKVPSNNAPLHAQAQCLQTSQTSDISENFPQLSFRVMNTFLLGSPVAVFLMIRNQHQPLREDYILPGCSRIFNIFHPYDPAAYRIEPLINPRNADAEAKIITHWKGGFRVHYQTKMLWKKVIDNTWKTQKHLIESLEKGMTEMGILDAKIDDLTGEEEDEYVNESDEMKVEPVCCGKLNQGRRIDYMLQEKEIEISNEYVFALAAHSTYWGERDLSSFVARQLFRSSNEPDNDNIVSFGAMGAVASGIMSQPFSSQEDYFEYN